MIRSVIFLTCCLFIAFSSLSQISYQSSHYAEAGDTFMLTDVGLGQLIGVDFDTTGAGIVWDYSGLQVNSQSIFEYGNPRNSGFYFAYLTACTQACVNDGLGGPVSCGIRCNNIWDTLSTLTAPTAESLNFGATQIENGIDFFKNTGYSLENRLLGGSIEANGFPVNFTIIWGNADKLLEFPIEYNENFTDESIYDIDLNPLGVDLRYVRTRVREVEVDGWGSVITPYGRHDSVIRVKTTINDVDSLITGGNSNPIPQPEKFVYNWFSKDWGLPVLTYERSEAFGFPIAQSLNFIDSIRCIQPNAFFLFTPFFANADPDDTIIVNFNNFSTNSDTFYWYFDDPTSAQSTSTEANPDHEFVGPGPRDILLISCNKSCSPLICDTFSLTLFVNDPSIVTAEFDYSPQPASVYDTITFNNQSLNEDSVWWQFDDGTTSYADAPKHKYNALGLYEVMLVAWNEFHRDTTIQSLEIGDANAVSHINGHQAVQVRPNPAEGMVYLDFGGTERSLNKYRIIDLQGRIVQQGKLSGLNQQQITFDRTSISPGNYLLEISGAQLQQYHRLTMK